MDAPKLSWEVMNENKHYVSSPDNTKYAGSYQQDTPLVLNLRLWNNRYGTDKVLDVNGLVLNLYFDTLEDASLLPYLTVTAAGAAATLSISNGIATATFVSDIVISGQANDGTEKNAIENYVDISIILDVKEPDARLKSHDLKNLFIDVVDNE